MPLLRSPDAPREVNEAYLVHLSMGLCTMPEGTTVLRDVRRLCPGEALVVTELDSRLLQVDRLTPRESSTRHDLAGTAFLEELGATIAERSRGGGAVLSLSGGLDSAAIAAAGLRHLPSVEALSFVAPTLAPEAEIQAVAALQRAWPNLHVKSVDVSDCHDFPDLRPGLRDDPALVPVALLPARMRLWSQARSAAFHTVIEGEGADELFSMLPTPLDALRKGRPVDAARQILGSSGKRTLTEQALLLPFLPPILRHAWLRRRGSLEALLPAFASVGAVQNHMVLEAVDQYRASLVHRPFSDRVLEWLSAPTVVGAAMSRRYVAASLGIELEWPLLERNILELILGLHAQRPFPSGSRKRFLQRAVEGLVPDDVRLLSKNIGLYKAFIPRILSSPRAREAIRDTRVKARLAHLVRFERIEAMLDALNARHSLSMDALWHLECLVSFAEWYSRSSVEYGVE
jgi:asparagine synthase (glutamine-hydrolysing)